MCHLRWCPREDLNLHALAGTGPQPAAYASSATGARKRHYTSIVPACQFARKPVPGTGSAENRGLATSQGILNTARMVAEKVLWQRVGWEVGDLQ